MFLKTILLFRLNISLR